MSALKLALERGICAGLTVVVRTQGEDMSVCVKGTISRMQMHWDAQVIYLYSRHMMDIVHKVMFFFSFARTATVSRWQLFSFFEKGYVKNDISD